VSIQIHPRGGKLREEWKVKITGALKARLAIKIIPAPKSKTANL